MNKKIINIKINHKYKFKNVLKNLKHKMIKLKNIDIKNNYKKNWLIKDLKDKLLDLEYKNEILIAKN